MLELRGLAAQVYEHLKSRIRSGDIPPGTVLTVARTAKEYGVSRSPVQEAFTRLASEFLVEIKPRQGTRVIGFSLHDLAELYRLRLVVEQCAGELAVERASPEELNHIAALAEDMAAQWPTDASVNREYERYTELNYRFHLAAAEASHNQYVLRTFVSVMDHAAVGYTTVVKQVFLHRRHSIQTVHTQHRALVQALRDRDAAAFRAVVAAHNQATFETVQRLLGDHQGGV